MNSLPSDDVACSRSYTYVFVAGPLSPEEAAAAAAFFVENFLLFFCLFFFDGAALVVVVAEAGSFFLRCFLMDAFPARSKALVVVTQAERRIREMRRRTVLIADELIRIRGNDEIEILLVPECRPSL